MYLISLTSCRLRVPKYGAILEFLHFAILVVFFCLCLSSEWVFYDKTRLPLILSFSIDRVLDSVGKWEAIFVLFAFAFLLEEYAQAREHGWVGKCLV